MALFLWRGGEGSQTDLQMDDLRPQELIDDYRTPKVPDDTCCGLGETTLAKARTQPATGFVYMVNRFYEPETGRFTQADKLAFDPTQLASAQNNRWTYCGNDPVNLSDPLGSITNFALGLTLGGIGLGLVIAGWFIGGFAGLLLSTLGGILISLGVKLVFPNPESIQALIVQIGQLIRTLLVALIPLIAVFLGVIGRFLGTLPNNSCAVNQIVRGVTTFEQLIALFRMVFQ